MDIMLSIPGLEEPPLGQSHNLLNKQKQLCAPAYMVCVCCKVEFQVYVLQ